MPTTKQQFIAFHEAHPEIYTLYVEFVDMLMEMGVGKIRADEVLHRVRWKLIVDGKVDFATEELKVLHGNRYAMMLMLGSQKYADFFELKVAYDQ